MSYHESSHSSGSPYDSDMGAEDFVMKHCKFAEESLKSSAAQLPSQKSKVHKNEIISLNQGRNRNNSKMDQHEEQKTPSNHTDEQMEDYDSHSDHESAEVGSGSDHTLDYFASQADDELNSSDDDGENGEKRLGRQHNSLKELMAVEFAKAHKLKIEEDMKVIHERHVKLMREMDLNYKMIEQET